MQDLFDILKARGLKLAVAESCTGGLITAHITNIPGSSAILERGFVTYSNEAKAELLGVSPEILATHGAVSAQTAAAMAKGALKNSRADVAISTTGIAGPDGGSPEKPVGLVYTGYAFKDLLETRKHNFTGTREEIRIQTVDAALKTLLEILKETP